MRTGDRPGQVAEGICTEGPNPAVAQGSRCCHRKLGYGTIAAPRTPAQLEILACWTELLVLGSGGA